MILLELSCFAIVSIYLTVRVRRERRASDLFLRLGAFAIAAWIGEDSVIRAYGFYFYSQKWDFFLDRVPLAIVCIWPVVIHSAWDLSRALTARRRWLVAAAIVLADASLIEPIAVQTGLWRWTEPGLFTVPPIGVLGWALFAGACIAVVEYTPNLLLLLFAPLTTHLLLIISWWSFFRWMNGPLDPWPAIIVVWTAAIILVLFARRARVPAIDLWARLPGALFFFVLLILHWSRPLAIYAFAFAPPYIALLSGNDRME
jgi:hypothetical protein